MRTSNSIKNSITGSLANLINILINFFAQKIFISILGIEYLGFNGLFTNILSLLNIAELGIGEAIIFNMYKPIANNDKSKIKSLMKFYSKAYHIITITILVLGLCLTPFIEFFVGTTTVEINLKIVYIMFLLQTVASYVLTYKRSILYANQKNYVVNMIHIAYIVILNIIQLTILYYTKNYIAYILIKIILQLCENMVINYFANKYYPYLKEKDSEKLDKNTEKDIFTRIKAMFLHKIGSFVVNGTDNILISKFFSVTIVGLYSNYYMIISAVTNLFSQFITASTASVGNLLTENDEKKNYDVFKKIRFLNFYLATFTGTSILVIIQSFIKIWLGEEYLLPNIVIFVLVFNYYQKLMRKTYDSFMMAAGICVENRLIPIIESVLNIILSIIFLKIYGLVGVFLGTILSGLALWGYSYPKFMYKNILKRKYSDYFKETIGYILLFICIALLTYTIANGIIISNNILKLIVNILISLCVPNLVLILLFKKNESFIYFKSLVKNMINKVLKVDNCITNSK